MIYYKNRIVQVNVDNLPLSINRSAGIEIDNMGVKKFMPLLKNKRNSSADFAVHQLANASTNKSVMRVHSSEDLKIQRLELEFSSVFRDDLSPGLPPK